jgi:hypothetical protein
MELDFIEVENILQQNEVAVSRHVRLDSTDRIITLPQDMLGERLCVSVTYTDGGSERIDVAPQFASQLTIPVLENSPSTIRSIYIQKRPRLKHEMALLVRTDSRNGKIKLVTTSSASGLTSELHINIFVGLRDYQLRHMAGEINLPGMLWQSFFDVAHRIYDIYYARAAQAIHVHNMGATNQNIFQVTDATVTIYQEETDNQTQRPFVADLNTETEDDQMQLLCIVNGTVLGLAAMDEISHQAPQQAVKLVNIGYMGTPADLLTTLSLNYGGLSIKTQIIILFASEYSVAAYQQILLDIDYAKYRDNTVLYLQGHPTPPSNYPPFDELLAKYVTVAHSLEEAVALSLQANRRG